ncbi:MAG: excinuclease ABC subunit UvrA [Candidatus Eremiobacteraeota bacterium]|nr:excinuclease ABC subunit UvrA [Candidatus Eremiobacteraeota bacterium]
MALDKIIIRGAREHNLKNISLEFPREKIIVITGISGSGKSSLAFDTIFAEGQRRYMESLSSYARQFLGQMEKPDVDYIEGLSPAISIDQKSVSHNPRSTVGTVTEIYDYLRLLFARVGKPHCYKCGRPIESQTIDQMVDRILSLPEKTKIMIMSPLVRGRKGEYKKLFEDYRERGYLRMRVNGEVMDLDEEIKLDRYKKHNIELIIDRVVIKPGVNGRVADSMETALKIGDNTAVVQVIDGEDMLFSGKMSCIHCGISFEDQEPRMFSFNTPYGACPRCTGIGFKLELAPELVVPDLSKSISQGALVPFGKPNRNFRHNKSESWFWERFRNFAVEHDIDMDAPLSQLDDHHRQIVLYGTAGDRTDVRFFRGLVFEGVIPNLERRYKQTDSDYIRREIEKYMADLACPDCGGARLKPQSLAVTIGGKNIAQISAFSIKDCLNFFDGLEFTGREYIIARRIVKEIRERLQFMVDVGLEYLTLSRTAGTLAGGEAQRIRLATQIGSSLVGVLYIMDEPSIGLHQRDNRRLLDTLVKLQKLGNTLIVVEHDEETILTADHVIDIGPGAGVHGGEIVFQGTPEEILECEESCTGKYLSGKLSVTSPRNARTSNGNSLWVRGARHHNLKNIDVEFPLGLFICVTGVSGSGKSSLVNDILYRALARRFHSSLARPGEHDSTEGWRNLDKVIIIDQSPIGRTPRSNPATYTGVFTPIRQLFTATREARKRGYQQGRFSFNIRGGRCEACQGAGILKIEMHFLPDVYVPCEVCKGKRYNRETLQVLYKGKSISDVLKMTVEEAMEFFANIPKIHNKLKTIYDVGLGYIELGQPATTLSGGEAQRVKLSTELSKRATGKTLYMLDEPTTGLHFHDVARLLKVLHRLVESGNTIIVIEHHLDVIKSADYIVDLGPEGGDGGGQVVCCGSPEDVANCEESYTGHYLKKIITI